ncbi:MAG TPA: FadR/GntR family transcriptional regulator [Solirubrobacteraceae bacterium]|nr:FadR/GntR family transcriptional regulator [Solirubrobacteraceae bacterium]
MTEPLLSPPRIGVAPVHVSQRHEQIAAQLRHAIATGRMAQGERLPPERELAQRMGVGRNAVREALGLLQVEGLVETRQGAGSFVRADALDALVHQPPEPADSTSPSELLDARDLIEPETAALAARNGGPDVAAALTPYVDAMEAAGDPDDPEQRVRWNEADRAFHRAIAHLSGNAVLFRFAAEVADLMDEPLWQQLRDESIAIPGRTRIHMAEHRMILEAIASGDERTARLYAAEHLKRVRRYMTLD